MSLPLYQYSTAFNLVAERFKATLSENDKKQFATTELKDLHIAIEKIQRTQHSEKKSIAMKRLGRFLEGMKQYEELVKIFLNTSNLLAFVWGPMKFLLQVASTFHEAFDVLMDAYQQIGEHIPLLKKYESHFRDQKWMIRVLILIYEDILNFHWKAIRYFKKRVWQQLFQALWKNFNAEFAGILRNLHEHMALIESQATIEQFGQVLQARELAETILHEQRQAETFRRQRTVYQWLSAPNCESDQETFSKVSQKYHGTGKWLFQKDRFRSWFDADFCSTHLLWLNGIPGAGKTILASLIVEKARLSPKIETAFFYCRYKDPDRNSFISVARGILAQLVSKDDAILSYLYEMASKSGQVTLATESLAKELLKTVMKSFQTLYVVIDGIDECDRDERKEIVSFFERVWEALPEDDTDSFRCLCISQDDNIARNDFANWSSLKVTETDTKADISSFAKARGLELKEKFDLSKEKQVWIGELIVDKAEGMFLYAHLMTSHLYSQTSKVDLERELAPNAVPQGPSRLEDLYSRIIERITSGNGSLSDKSLLVLRWLVCAKRPLLWREIQAVVSIDVSDQSVDCENRRFCVDSKDLCGSLIDIHADGTINFIHQTAKRHLIDKSLVDLPSGEHAFALLCLEYLSFEGFDCNNPELEVLAYVPAGYYGFMDYAYAYWARHIDTYFRQRKFENKLSEISEAAEVFIDIHWTEPRSKSSIPKSVLERWSIVRENRNFEKLLQAGYLSQKQLHASSSQSLTDGVLKLDDFIQRVRNQIETASITSDQDFKLIYGTDVYKCPRVNCVRFYRGFSSGQERDEHVAKHDRSFFCPFPGCPMALLGCSTLKELQKHETEYHGTVQLDEDEPEYPELPPEKVSFDCTYCDAKFTRKHNLKIHMRCHIAPNEKIFVCSKCGKSFSRLGDRTRHNTITHNEAKSFICGGLLKNQTPWGCGHDFKRKDELKRHWKSLKGKACVLPKQQEEDEEINSSKTSAQPSGESNT